LLCARLRGPRFLLVEWTDEGGKTSRDFPIAPARRHAPHRRSAPRAPRGGRD